MSIDPKAMEAARRIVENGVLLDMGPPYSARMATWEAQDSIIVARALLAGAGNNATAAAVPIDPWQPISTAPKDGMLIILGSASVVGSGYYWQNANRKHPRDRWVWNGWPQTEPTCWLLLPAPPAGDANQQSKAGLTQASDSLARPSSSPSPAVRDVTEPEVLREAALSGDVAFIQDALGMERDVTLREALEKCRQLASSSSGLGIHSSAGDFLDQLDAIFGVALNALRYPALSHPSLPDGGKTMTTEQTKLEACPWCSKRLHKGLGFWCHMDRTCIGSDIIVSDTPERIAAWNLRAERPGWAEAIEAAAAEIEATPELTGFLKGQINAALRALHPSVAASGEESEP